KPVVG
uniref:Cryptide Pep-25 n=1 Tax=Tityus obscurus TaxID=1221240 RepID=CRY25_TITOB